MARLGTPAPLTKMSYDRLWKKLNQRNWHKQDLQKAAGLSSSSIAKLSRNANLHTDTLLRICQVLDCGIAEICEVVPAEQQADPENTMKEESRVATH